jgi:hypothetical protein
MRRFGIHAALPIGLHMRRLLRQILLVALCVLVLAPVAKAELLLGAKGSMSRMHSLTGQRSDARLKFIRWGQGQEKHDYFAEWWPRMGNVGVLSFNTLGIARGDGDRWLRKLSQEIHAWGRPLIIRPLAEMNGHWNAYSAYNANGTRRNAAHSQANYRRAFRRIYLILHGGERDAINAKLRRYNMPGVRADLAENPAPTLRVLWNPQGFGSPNVAGNRAHVYYPGDAYVDIVRNDLYESASWSAQWSANLALFRRYSNKPFAFGEFGLWGVDHPSFITRMAKFLRSHSRVVLAVYNDAERGSVFDLGSKPKSRAAYRKYITPLNR